MTPKPDSSLLLDEEPLVLDSPDDAVPCLYTPCEATASWSTLWSCGETAPYCDEHRGWAESTSTRNGMHCECPSTVGRIIHLVMTVPL